VSAPPFAAKILSHPLVARLAITGYVAFTTLRFAVIRIAGRFPLLVVFRAGGLGDVIATAPAVAALRASHPRHRIVFCTRAEFVDIATLIPGVDRVLPVFHGDALAAFASRWFDTRRFRYRDEYDPAGSSEHFVVEMAASAGVTLPVGASPRLNVPAMSDAEFAEWFGCDLAGRRVIALHAGPSAAVREWPLDRWRALAAGLADRPDLVIVQIGSGRHFLHGSKDVTVQHAVQPQRLLSLLESARLLRSCALLIGIDSGPLHLAAAVGTPVVGIFGPVNPALRIPAGAQAVVAAPRLDCQFCHHRVPRGHWETGCPHDIACLSSIPSEAVLKQIDSSIQPPTLPVG